MATLHFVKDGLTAKGMSLTKGHKVEIGEALSKLGERNSRFSEGVPRINPDKRANEFAEYRYVVLEVAPGEEGGLFEKPGYYFFPELAPRDCQSLFEQSGPVV